MPAETTEDLVGTPEAVPPAESGGASLSLSADLVRNSPEYRALQKQMREQARETGRIRADAEASRAEAESIRQAAEAARQQAMAEQLTGILGDEGVEAFNQIAELSESDPVEAARRFREFAASVGQTQPAPPTVAPAVSTGGAKVSEQSAPPPPDTGVSGDTPLGQPTTGIDWDAIATDASRRYADIVERNQDPIMRARVTDRERGEGFMSWLAASYVKGMKNLGRLPRS